MNFPRFGGEGCFLLTPVTRPAKTLTDAVLTPRRLRVAYQFFLGSGIENGVKLFLFDWLAAVTKFRGAGTHLRNLIVQRRFMNALTDGIQQHDHSANGTQSLGGKT